MTLEDQSSTIISKDKRHVIDTDRTRQMADVAYVNSFSKPDKLPQMGNAASEAVKSGSLFSVCGKPGELGTVVLRVDYDIPEKNNGDRYVELSLVGVYGPSGRLELAEEPNTTRRNIFGKLDVYNPFYFEIKDEDGSPDRLPFHIPTSINTKAGAIDRKSDHYKSANLSTARASELNLRTSDISIGHGYYNEQVPFHPTILRNGPGEEPFNISKASVDLPTQPEPVGSTDVGPSSISGTATIPGIGAQEVKRGSESVVEKKGEMDSTRSVESNSGDEKVEIAEHISELRRQLSEIGAEKLSTLDKLQPYSDHDEDRGV